MAKKIGRPRQGKEVKQVRSVRVTSKGLIKIIKKYGSLQAYVDAGAK